MVNINELRKKYEQIQNAQQGGGNAEFLKKFFMMEEGTSVVRILPGKEDEEFYAETAIHRIDDRNYHCPRVKGDVLTTTNPLLSLSKLRLVQTKRSLRGWIPYTTFTV